MKKRGNKWKYSSNYLSTRVNVPCHICFHLRTMKLNFVSTNRNTNEVSFHRLTTITWPEAQITWPLWAQSAVSTRLTRACRRWVQLMLQFAASDLHQSSSSSRRCCSKLTELWEMKLWGSAAHMDSGSTQEVTTRIVMFEAWSLFTVETRESADGNLSSPDENKKSFEILLFDLQTQSKLNHEL